MSQGLTTIFMGPVVEAELLKAELEAMGIPAFIPDDAMRTLDPLAVGGLLVFDRAVQVPPSAVAAARAHLERRAEETPMVAGEEELPADFFTAETTEADELLARTRSLSRRIFWCAIVPFAAPFALWQFAQYLTEVKRLGRKPPLHAMTIAAACLSPLNVVVFLPMLARSWVG